MGNYDRPTGQPTNQQMEIRVHREVTLPIMINKTKKTEGERLRMNQLRSGER